MTFESDSLPIFDESELGSFLCAELRSDHAGETGAVAMYKGIIAVSRNREILEFAHTHLKTEQRHLNLLTDWLPAQYKSRLIPLWWLSGWMLGALCVTGGRRFTFITISAVESFVINHYEQQIRYAPQDIKVLLTSLQEDEAHHKKDAALRTGTIKSSRLISLWNKVIWQGSALAVSLAKRI